MPFLFLKAVASFGFQAVYWHHEIRKGCFWMKYVLVIGDGMADEPIPSLDGKTPLGYLRLPGFDRLAACGLGLCQTVPQGVAPGSDTAILNIFGYDPRQYYTGRSVLEAAGVGVFLSPGEVSLRVNLCAVERMGGDLIIHSHNGGGVEGDEAETLMNDLAANAVFSRLAREAGLTIHVSRTFRHIGVLKGPVPEEAAFFLTEPHNILEQGILPYYPKGYLAGEIRRLMEVSYQVLDGHPINEARRRRGLLPANMIWPWGPGRAARLPSFREKYGHGGAVVSAVPLVWGIAGLAGLPAPKVPGATGDLDTNYEGKVDLALSALQAGDDFAAVHVEAPDEMSHAGSLEKKLEALRRLDSRVISPLLSRLPALGDFRLLFLSDHLTLLSTRTHDGRPVPWALYDSRVGEKNGPMKFDEAACAKGLFLDNGDRLMPYLFEMEQ